MSAPAFSHISQDLKRQKILQKVGRALSLSAAQGHKAGMRGSLVCSPPAWRGSCSHQLPRGTWLPARSGSAASPGCTGSSSRGHCCQGSTRPRGSRWRSLRPACHRGCTAHGAGRAVEAQRPLCRGPCLLSSWLCRLEEEGPNTFSPVTTQQHRVEGGCCLSLPEQHSFGRETVVVHVGCWDGLASVLASA